MSFKMVFSFLFFSFYFFLSFLLACQRHERTFIPDSSESRHFSWCRTNHVSRRDWSDWEQGKNSVEIEIFTVQKRRGQLTRRRLRWISTSKKMKLTQFKGFSNSFKYFDFFFFGRISFFLYFSENGFYGERCVPEISLGFWIGQFATGVKTTRLINIYDTNQSWRMYH